jgi:hypothetical protein
MDESKKIAEKLAIVATEEDFGERKAILLLVMDHGQCRSVIKGDIREMTSTLAHLYEENDAIKAIIDASVELAKMH